MGVNLAFGIIAGFTFIFFDKIFGVLVDKTDLSPAIGAWLPLGIFGILSNCIISHMPNARSKSLLHLHFLVFIWGFTSILGALMNKSPFEIVWFRVVIASSLIAVYFLFFKPKII